MNNTKNLLFVVLTVSYLDILPNTALEPLCAVTVEAKNIKIILIAIFLFVQIAIRKAIHLHLDIAQLLFQKKSLFKMKLLQFNITSLNTSLEELWGYEKENDYDAIFLQETNYTAKKPLAYLKYWKTKIFTDFLNKAMGLGMGTLVSSAKKMFSERISHTRT